MESVLCEFGIIAPTFFVIGSETEEWNLINRTEWKLFYGMSLLVCYCMGLFSIGLFMDSFQLRV